MFQFTFQGLQSQLSPEGSSIHHCPPLSTSTSLQCRFLQLLSLFVRGMFIPMRVQPFPCLCSYPSHGPFWSQALGDAAIRSLPGQSQGSLGNRSVFTVCKGVSLQLQSPGFLQLSSSSRCVSLMEPSLNRVGQQPSFHNCHCAGNWFAFNRQGNVSLSG